MANWIVLKKTYKPPQDPKLLPEVSQLNVNFNVDQSVIITRIQTVFEIYTVLAVGGLQMFVDKEGKDSILGANKLIS